ncbi:MAG TPA: DUF3078 domain-containing protein [Ignavibacteria bacterium]|nr:DUF3078 domain-containing protein [Ignavibacteria bacterium]
MKRALLLLILVFTAALLSAQVDTSLKYGWTPRGAVALNLSQISFSNWTQGGEDAVAFAGLGNFGVLYHSKKWDLYNSLKLAYGKSKTSGSFKTTDNELRLNSILIRHLGWVVNPYFSNEVRSSISNGYDYSVSPEIQTAAFFDPGYITQSLGFIYSRKNFSTRLGVGLQEVITREFTKYSDDPDTQDEIEKFKLETGIESVTEANVDLMQNILYSSRLRLFSRFNTLDVWDVNWDNIITAKVNDYINVNLGVNIIYEKKASFKTQIKEALQVGFSYVIF